MSEEEKEAIDKFEKLLVKNLNEEIIFKEDKLSYIEGISILYLIDKLQKENEELDKENRELREENIKLKKELNK